MKRTRRKFSGSFKTKVVLEALKERKTLSELAEQFNLHPHQVSAWKKEFLNNAEKAFGDDKHLLNLSSRKAQNPKSQNQYVLHRTLTNCLYHFQRLVSLLQQFLFCYD